ncbi:YtnP family quorum-quenching lactonase [Aquisalibacillus elongatus]|uniref:Glyoxylase-like metal-dependent hydrolase (Beta-lactamase superfamily II) n=1 Tax=Aquisalibacillus elongatus TaxID=485577 RepID=A0A3N5C9P0_9BACI|nr:MBL fold metallo-hydrolase [Aquisalibacillus elongatus]RPF55305.1 glyoxylase-like metal-dependent hydrolase (beta-lactamase superfamily II) [Aquisalibacillus elongatus]
MKTLSIGRAKLTWLNGGVTHMDGGAMFGVVPKPLWSKKYPHNDRNQIELRCDSILVQIDGKNFLIDSGIGKGKLNDKSKRNFGVFEESKVDESLETLGLSADDIDAMLMTHLHFDHANGLTKPEGDDLVSAFPNATIFTSQVEWDEMREPNIRSKNTYWKENWEPVQHQVKTFDESIEIVPGLTMHHTSGHSDGHSVIKFVDGDESFIHMADLMPTHAHQNPLWVLAYDDYPVTSVQEKKALQDEAYAKNSWFVFYHDAYYRAVQFNDDKEIEKSIERERYEY